MKRRELLSLIQRMLEMLLNVVYVRYAFVYLYDLLGIIFLDFL
jgi:hypothetical protein